MLRAARLLDWRTHESADVAFAPAHRKVPFRRPWVRYTMIWTNYGLIYEWNHKLTIPFDWYILYFVQHSLKAS